MLKEDKRKPTFLVGIFIFMKFQIYNQKYNVPDLMHQIGYKPIGTTERNELNCVRPMGADYPRFHIYVKEDKLDNRDVLSFSLHLDQKKPVYEGVTAHGGDYEGEVVQDEAQRIRDVIFR